MYGRCRLVTLIQMHLRTVDPEGLSKPATDPIVRPAGGDMVQRSSGKLSNHEDTTHIYPGNVFLPRTRGCLLSSNGTAPCQCKVIGSQLVGTSKVEMRRPGSWGLSARASLQNKPPGRCSISAAQYKC